MNQITKIKLEANKLFHNLGPSHDWAHVERVLKTALILGRKEKADLKIIKIATYLHDVGRKDLKEIGYDHAIEGSTIARKILKKYRLSKEDVDNVCHCIEAHRFRKGKNPISIEAKCLHDADKLDVLGAVGIARSYIYLGETRDCVLYKKSKRKTLSKKRTNSVQEEYEVKYKYLPDKMSTKTGKAIALKRLKYMKSFLDRLEQEVKGN